MNRGYSGGKRSREANRDLKKREKEDRLRRNRELRARGIEVTDDPLDLENAAPLPEVKLEDVVIGVASRPRRGDFGPTKLFIGGLSSDTTTKEIQTAFAPFGEIVDAIVIADRSTGQSRGFGFVTYQSSAAADAAIKQMNGAELDGRTLKVNRAEAR
jgi:RNA recognition motif. (a.k.a. RRM, RBD, or RNP domain)